MKDRKHIKIIVIIAVILVALLSYYFYYQNNMLQLGVYSIESEKLPAAFDGSKIVQISDFHNTNSELLRNSLIEEIKNQAPDIIVITGDIVDSRNTNVDIAEAFVKEIKDVAKIYYVPGNHEARIGAYSELKTKLQELGVTVLENRAEYFEMNGESIELIGLIDPMFAHERTVKDKVVAAKMLEDLSFDKEYYTILLAHRPELFELYQKSGFDLILSGHAHGGQIRLPFIGPFFVPSQGFMPKYAEGLIEEDSTMIISRGIGNSLAPLRINNRPELVIVELHSVNAGN